MRSRRQQGGWTFLIVLVALAIVAYLARDLLRQMFGTVTRAAASSEPRPGAQPVPDATQATPAPSTPIERARAVEDVVQRQVDRIGKELDAPR